jgi:phage shock protein A
MKEAISTRVGRLIAGSVNALINAVEDAAPEMVMEQALREIDGATDDVRAELGKVLATRHLATKRLAEENQKHETLGDQIELAVAQNREDLAEAAIAKQFDIEAQIPVLETTLAEHVRQETELQGYVAALLAKQREMQEALEAFRKSRAAAASAAATAGAAGSNAEQRMGAVTGAFDRLYQRQTGLSGTDRTASLEQTARLKELDDLVRENKIAERMAQIKAGKA